MKHVTLGKEKEKTQKVFNSWIRERDKGLTCVSCKNPAEQAGHYYSAGHYDALRFDEINTNGQCVRCNYFLSGNLIEYRKGLVKKYGEAEVEKLDIKAGMSKRVHRKWDRLELQLIRDIYKQKLKQAA